MSLEIKSLGTVGTSGVGAVTIQLAGSLNTATAPELEGHLTPVLAGTVKDIVFDLARLKFITSAALVKLPVALRLDMRLAGRVN